MTNAALQEDMDWETRAKLGRLRRLGLVLGLVLLAQMVGSLVTIGTIDSWYPTLLKPDWNPPNWVFGPVWTLLYALMAWSAWRIWQRLVGLGVPEPWGHVSLRAFTYQLALNVLWSVLFFGWQQPLYAMLELVILIVAMIWMIWAFRPVSRAASVAQYPYLLWLLFAFALNAAIVALNH